MNEEFSMGAYEYSVTEENKSLRAENDALRVENNKVKQRISQPPKWMFTDDKGNLVSREVLIGRMYNHIMNVVTHYKGRVKGW